MLTLLWLLLLCYGVSNSHCTTIPDNSTDMLSLLDFRESINDLAGALRSWNTSISHCKWPGVDCSLKHPGRVTALSLGGLGLAGPIPPSIGNLTFLGKLNLSINSFSGEFPPLNRLHKLQELILAENSLQGTIPDEIWQLPNLQRFIVSGNNLSGRLPGTLLNRSSLQIIDLTMNMLGGALPSNFGDMLPNLQVLYLHQNKFEGNIPASLGNISWLKALDLSFNDFTGQVPSSLGKHGLLQSINLQKNKLEANDSQSWEFIDTLSNFSSSLQELILGQNLFQGVIPNSIGKMTDLQQLGLGINDFTGTVPSNLGNLTGLTKLELRNNSLSGPIDEWVGKLKNLEGLILSANKFNGPIPSLIGNFTKLSILLLEENEFEGPIPSSLGNLPILSRLNLSYNNLWGSIPKEIFPPGSTLSSCALSYNNLNGSVPSVIGNLKQVLELRLSSNKFTGEIPTTLGNCEKLQILELDHNFLRGNISMTLSGLQSMTTLNLSYNNLSGVIPPKLADLRYLTQLDLSYNNLQGDVPTNGVFGHATSISLLGNRGLCGGVPDLHLPPCPVVSQRKETPYYLIRVLIPIFGFMSLMLLVYFVLTEKKMSRSKLPFPFLDEKLIKVSYEDLAQATQNFSQSNLIGSGSYGSVYRGKLVKGKLEVAVKVLNLDMHGAEKSFLSECEALRSIQHQYAGGGRSSTYGDIYSFGIVLLEMLTGKRPTDPVFENGLNVVNFVERAFPDQVMQVIDDILQEECGSITQSGSAAGSRLQQSMPEDRSFGAGACNVWVPEYAWTYPQQQG
ncbi:hypothetical protein PR202_gb09074 [Eleusine coracana subsp. coracana]|uniref:non-specific serine/threonine protein kinase n=1 Tax=Eleusine coracana subsp. coracana TaxID=191504 RepID=A0AAV5EFI9_ELECO|nr:hypothetical protein PR202_gb09074 [Eleusine coracana subsp. coracana]